MIELHNPPGNRYRIPRKRKKQLKKIYDHYKELEKTKKPNIVTKQNILEAMSWAMNRERLPMFKLLNSSEKATYFMGRDGGLYYDSKCEHPAILPNPIPIVWIDESRVMRTFAK